MSSRHGQLLARFSPQTTGDVTGGRAFLASGEPRPAPCPHPMPALLAADGSGLRLLGCSQSCIFGECFTLGNRPGILKERPPPSPAKVSFSCFRKEVPRKRVSRVAASFSPQSRHSPAAAHRGTVRGPDGWSPQPSSQESKSRSWRWTDGVTYYCDKEKSLRASIQNSGQL